MNLYHSCFLSVAVDREFAVCGGLWLRNALINIKNRYKNKSSESVFFGYS